MSSVERPLPALPSLEGLRLVASVMVVALHYATYLQRDVDPLHLSVDLFFVISGIVISMVYDGHMHGIGDWASFMRKRLARLYPLHFATLLFYVAIAVLVWRGTLVPDNPEKYDPANLLPNLFLVHAWSPNGRISFNYVSWSISAEFFVYLTFPIALRLVRSGFFVGLLACSVLLAAAIAAAHLVVGDTLFDLNWRFGVVRAVPGFLYGCWIWEWRERLLAGLTPALRPDRAFLGATLAFVVLSFLSPTPYLLLAVVWAIVLFAFLADMTGRPTWAGVPALAERGPLTYSIYMLHPVAATVVISFIFPRLLGRSFETTLLSLPVAAAVTWVAAVISHRWFESPVRRLIAGRGR